MRTVGEILRQERRELKKNLTELALELKVKTEYLSALEKDEYQAIPGGVPIITGILSNYSRVLKLDPVKMRAIFRRDYIGGTGAVLPDEIQDKNNFWTPTRAVGLSILFLTILIGFFYYSRSFLLSGPPALSLSFPKEGELVVGDQVVVRGRVRRADVVAVNGEKVLLTDNGSFELALDCQSGENLIFIEASNHRQDQKQLTRRFICQKE